MTIVMWTKPVVVLQHTLYVFILLFVATPPHDTYEPSDQIFYFFFFADFFPSYFTWRI